MAEQQMAPELVQNVVEAAVSLPEAIGISVVASIISVVIIAVIRFLYNKGLFEYIQKQIKKTHLSIEGEWLAESKEVNDEHGEFEYRDQTTLKQIGRNISGESLYTTKHNGNVVTKKFKIHGYIKNDVFVGTYENLSSDSLGVGSFAYIIQNDGKRLAGPLALYDTNSRTIGSEQYELNKIIGN